MKINPSSVVNGRRGAVQRTADTRRPARVIFLQPTPKVLPRGGLRWHDTAFPARPNQPRRGGLARRSQSGVPPQSIPKALALSLPCKKLRCAPRQLTNASAFTLIEIMVVVGIMAVIMAIGFPSVYQQMHKDSMRQALKDISDACMEARQRAILTGRTTEVRFRPRERTINVVEGAAGESSGPSYGFHGGDIVEKPASGGAIFSAKLSEKIRLVYAEVNCEVELQDRAEFTCLFRPNGTCDLMGLVLRADPNNEGRKLVTDEVTGMIDWEVVP